MPAVGEPRGWLEHEDGPRAACVGHIWVAVELDRPADPWLHPDLRREPVGEVVRNRDRVPDSFDRLRELAAEANSRAAVVIYQCPAFHHFSSSESRWPASASNESFHSLRYGASHSSS